MRDKIWMRCMLKKEKKKKIKKDSNHPQWVEKRLEIIELPPYGSRKFGNYIRTSESLKVMECSLVGQ